MTLSDTDTGYIFRDRDHAEDVAASCRRGDPDGWKYTAVITSRGWVVEVWDEGRFLGDLQGL